VLVGFSRRKKPLTSDVCAKSDATFPHMVKVYLKKKKGPCEVP